MVSLYVELLRWAVVTSGNVWLTFCIFSFWSIDEFYQRYAGPDVNSECKKFAIYV